MADNLQTMPPRGLPAVKKLLNGNMRTVEALLNGFTSPQRFLGGIVTAMQVNPALQQCVPESVLLAALRIAQLRLSPDPALGQAWLIPRDRKDERSNTWSSFAEFQLGYRGTLALLYRSPRVASVRYSVVRRGDAFRFVDGAKWILEHTPSAEGWPETMDLLEGAWAIIELNNGRMIPRYMPKAEILRHKARGKGRQPAWDTDPAAMSVKTVLNDIGKRGPLEGEGLLAVNLDETGEHDLGQQVEDLEAEVFGSPEARAAAATIVSRASLPTETGGVTIDMPGQRPAEEVPAGGGGWHVDTPEEAHLEQPTTSSPKPPPAAATVAPPQDDAQRRAHQPKPWQAVLDLGLPRVGDEIASRLHAAGITTYEHIVEEGALSIGKKIMGVGKLGAEAMVMFAERKLMPEPPVQADRAKGEGGGATAAARPREQAPPPPPPPAEDPFEGMDTKPLTTTERIPFPGQEQRPRPLYPAPGAQKAEPPRKISKDPVTRIEVRAMLNQATRTKRAGAPAGQAGDAAAEARMRAFVAERFDCELEKMPRAYFRAAMEWASEPGGPAGTEPTADTPTMAELRAAGVVKG
jgi:phage RecT family recombinase